jgi:methyl-accepting chemotaxis protein
LIAGEMLIASVLDSPRPLVTAWGIVASMIFLLGLGVGTHMAVARTIGRPLRLVEEAGRRLANGDLSAQSPIDRGDEIGQISEALNGVNVGLAGLIRNVTEATLGLTRASREIAAGNTDLANRTERQAASLQEVANTMAQLTETVKQNAGNAQQASALAAAASEAADAQGHVVQQMIETIEKVSASSKRISEITALIEGIAVQTNILALNAAVEAARAGEQGRGFAVVAEEVRALAQRSSIAAKEIKGLIESSVGEIRAAVGRANEAGSSMVQVKESISGVSVLAFGIAAASTEQSRGVDQVHRTVQALDEMTQQNAALVEEAAAASESLKLQALKLNDAASVFKLAGSSSPATSHRV